MSRIFNEPKPEPRSRPPVTSSAHAVICWEHGKVLLSEQEYQQQERQPELRWYCPICNRLASLFEGGE